MKGGGRPDQGRPAEPDVYRYPDGEVLERRIAKQWKRFRGLCAGATAFAAMWIVVTKYLAPGLPLVLVVLGWLVMLAILIGTTYFSTRKAERSSRQFAGYSVVVEGGVVLWKGPTGEVVATIDPSRPMQVERISNGELWHIVVRQGNDTMFVTDALPGSHALCMDVLRIGDPRCVS